MIDLSKYKYIKLPMKIERTIKAKYAGKDKLCDIPFEAGEEIALILGPSYDPKKDKIVWTQRFWSLPECADPHTFASRIVRDEAAEPSFLRWIYIRLWQLRNFPTAKGADLVDPEDTQGGDAWNYNAVPKKIAFRYDKAVRRVNNRAWTVDPNAPRRKKYSEEWNEYLRERSDLEGAVKSYAAELLGEAAQEELDKIRDLAKAAYKKAVQVGKCVVFEEIRISRKEPMPTPDIRAIVDPDGNVWIQNGYHDGYNAEPVLVGKI